MNYECTHTNHYTPRRNAHFTDQPLYSAVWMQVSPESRRAVGLPRTMFECIAAASADTLLSHILMSAPRQRIKLRSRTLTYIDSLRKDEGNVRKRIIYCATFLSAYSFRTQDMELSAGNNLLSSRHSSPSLPAASFLPPSFLSSLWLTPVFYFSQMGLLCHLQITSMIHLSYTCCHHFRNISNCFISAVLFQRLQHLVRYL